MKIEVSIGEAIDKLSILELKLKKINNEEKKKEIVHGLLRSQSIKQKCEIIHNRDKNAVQNMLNIVKSIFNTGKRPEAFCRIVPS